MDELKVGDVVRIANGPKMTVESIGTHQIKCVWFDEDSHLCRDLFMPAILSKVPLPTVFTPEVTRPRT